MCPESMYRAGRERALVYSLGVGGPFYIDEVGGYTSAFESSSCMQMASIAACVPQTSNAQCLLSVE